MTPATNRVSFDFTGTAAMRPGNINAVAPMTASATFFAVKLLTDPTLPVNAGTFRPVRINIPAGSFLNARHPAAVCAGTAKALSRQTTGLVCVVDADLRSPVLGNPETMTSGFAPVR